MRKKSIKKRKNEIKGLTNVEKSDISKKEKRFCRISAKVYPFLFNFEKRAPESGALLQYSNDKGKAVERL